MNRAAEMLGYVFHPALVMLAAVFIASLLLRQSAILAVLDVGILLLGLLPGLTYIYVRAKRGEFSHYHLILREERPRVLVLLFIGVLVSFALYLLSNVPALMVQAMVAGLLCGAGAILITRFWKISLHATVAMGCAALFLPLSWGWVLAFALAGLLVGVARIIVQHHSTAQVVAGWVYGFGLTALLLFALGAL